MSAYIIYCSSLTCTVVRLKDYFYCSIYVTVPIPNNFHSSKYTRCCLKNNKKSQVPRKYAPEERAQPNEITELQKSSTKRRKNSSRSLELFPEMGQGYHTCYLIGNLRPPHSQRAPFRQVLQLDTRGTTLLQRINNGLTKDKKTNQKMS